MATRNRKIACCICILAALFLGFLGRGSAEAAVGEADKVTCMYPVWVGFGPVHLANELGYF
jgi:NitT/TauT family transport system substrate-binding protein